MYQALYRKYRPKNFNEVVGQNIVIKTLSNSLINNKINHAYLFAGPRGSGKTSIAKIFAKLVNCKNPNGTVPCNKCVFCTQKEEQILDIIEMDAASNNGVDEIRDINTKVNLVPSVGKYKIYIIDEVHMLTIGAFNALLKTLEEPPAHVIFILATTDPHKVPITILSRCQRFDFKKLSEESILEKLKYICEKEKIDIEPLAIKEISILGDGSLRDAIGMLDQVISYTNEKITLQDIYDVNGIISDKEVYSLLKYTIAGDLNNVITLISNYNNNGKSIIKITEEIIQFLRNVLVSQTNLNFLGNNEKYYREILNELEIDKILEIISIFNDSLLDMKKFANTKMILELAFIKIINSIVKIKKNEISIQEQENLKIEINNKNLEQENTIKKEELEIVKQIEEKNEVIKTSLVENFENEIELFIDLRVNNTLAQFSKKDTNELKQKISSIRNYLMNDEYNDYATIILDSQLKAVGGENMIFSCPTKHLSNLFNENIEQIENLLYKEFKIKYKVIAVCDEKWNVIREQFNSKKNSYVYKNEDVSINEILKKIKGNEEDSIKSLFGELVEYK